MLSKSLRGLICCHDISSINLFRIEASTLRILNERATPLNRRLCGDCPTIIFDDHEHWKLMHTSLSQQDIEIICRSSTIAACIQDNIVFVLALNSVAKAAREGRKASNLTEAWQNAMLFTAIVRRHIASCNRTSDTRIGFAQRSSHIARSL